MGPWLVPASLCIYQHFPDAIVEAIPLLSGHRAGFSPCFPQQLSYCHTMASSHPPVKLHAWWISKPHPVCYEWLSAINHPWLFGELCEIWLFSSPPQLAFLCPCAYIGAKKKTTKKHPCPHCCFAIQQDCKTPLANPTLAGVGNVGKTTLLAIWLVSSSKEEIQLSTHPQSQAQVQSEAGCLKKTLRGRTVPLHPLTLGICMLLDELQLWYRWT